MLALRGELLMRDAAGITRFFVHVGYIIIKNSRSARSGYGMGAAGKIRKRGMEIAPGGAKMRTILPVSHFGSYSALTSPFCSQRKSHHSFRPPSVANRAPLFFTRGLRGRAEYINKENSSCAPLPLLLISTVAAITIPIQSTVMPKCSMCGGRLTLSHSHDIRDAALLPLSHQVSTLNLNRQMVNYYCIPRLYTITLNPEFDTWSSNNRLPPLEI